MKKIITTITTLSTSIVALLFAVNANAGLLNIDFSADDIKVGQSVTVTINAQDFDATDMFDFDLNFDNSILAFDETSLNSDLLLPDADMDMFDGLEVANQDWGLSFDFTDSVMSADGNFMLVSFDLIATAAGMSNFALVDFWNIEAFTEYDIVFSGSDSINVSVVPEPSTVFMMMLAGFALFNMRRQAK
ncbi:hypothetical protein CXF85_09720 [Colwellia sp. 75C3]|uniref:PEP-CTERM sorting domain-containing protein n=1 Tax=Colwellia sp. 75C3 TaxID=888425 RepID=UPI000C334BFC|nr:PEP-CTERM sorting domain-containing protein [Colwellia sp. 75C3]PKG83775.1 hypothetical protein CXF85_09720 [Colwellia sp. 75C3]